MSSSEHDKGEQAESFAKVNRLWFLIIPAEVAVVLITQRPEILAGAAIIDVGIVALIRTRINRPNPPPNR